MKTKAMLHESENAIGERKATAASSYEIFAAKNRGSKKLTSYEVNYRTSGESLLYSLLPIEKKSF